MDALYLGQTLGIVPRASEGLTESVFGREVSSSCRFEERTQVVKNDSGELVTSDAHVFLPALTALTVLDQVVYGGKSYQVLKVARRRDLEGECSVEAWLGAM